MFEYYMNKACHEWWDSSITSKPYNPPTKFGCTFFFETPWKTPLANSIDNFHSTRLVEMAKTYTCTCTDTLQMIP